MASNRTEKPTPKRREDARKKGQIARRPELSGAFAFLAALVVLKLTGPAMLEQARLLMTGMLAQAGNREFLNPADVVQLAFTALARLALLSIPVVAAAMVAGVAANLAQGGFIFNPALLKPKTERFNPIANLKRTMGLDGVVQFMKGLLVIGFIIMACWGEVTRSLTQAPSLVGSAASNVLLNVGALIYQLALRAGLVILVVAVLDYAYGWYKHEKSLKMTKREIKDEYKQQEGDPQVKMQRRRAARALIQRQIAVEVPRADVIVTNPTHFAVALKYDSEKFAAPIVTAKGADEMARRIRELAREHNVPIVENPPLARTLYRKVDVGRVIPPELFRAVAELLAYVYRLRMSN